MNSILAQKLQIWGFEKDFIIYQDGSLGFAFEASPIDVMCWSSDQINKLAAKLDQFLNGLCPETNIQFIQEVVSGNELIISRHLELGENCLNPVVQTLTNERASRLNGLDQMGQVPSYKLKVLVRTKARSQVSRRFKLLSTDSSFSVLTEHELTREIQMATRLQTETTQAFSQLGIALRTLDVHEMINELYLQWNPTRQIKMGDYDTDDIRTSVLFTDALINQSGFSLGEMHYRVVSLKILPEVTVSSQAQVLRDLPFDSKLFLSIHVPDQQKELTHLQTQRRLAYSMARGKRSGVGDIESEAKFQDLESLLEQMIAQGERVFHSSLNVLLRSKDIEELESQVGLTLSKLRELSGAEAMTESLAAFDIFSEFAFPNAKALERSKRMKTTNLSDFLPIFGPWPGHDDPSILLRSRLGSLVKFDPFSKNLSNHNQLISGGSGSGKSYFTTILLTQLLKENPKVFIVDIGASYKKLCEHLDGQYIPLGANSSVSINPFDLLPNETKPSGEKIKFLLGLVEIISKEEGTRRLPKLERAEIEEAIGICYEVSKTPTLSTLQKILSDHKDPIIKRYARILSSWCGNSSYGKFVDRPTNLNLDRSIVSFDLKGLDNYPDLQEVCLFMIMDFVWRQIQSSPRDQKKIFAFDECWKLLESEVGSSILSDVFRTFRKYFAGVIAISQDIDDFAKSKVASAILPNSAVKWILMQKGANQARLQEVLQLNDNEMNLIASLHQERGKYSEAFLIAQDNRAVVAIEATPLEYWIATTDPRDMAVLEKTAKENPKLSKTEVLYQLSREFPAGVTNLKEV